MVAACSSTSKTLFETTSAALQGKLPIGKSICVRIALRLGDIERPAHCASPEVLRFDRHLCRTLCVAPHELAQGCRAVAMRAVEGTE